MNIACEVSKSPADSQPPSTSFDLKQIKDESTRTRVALQIQRIHRSIRCTAKSILEIGSALLDIQDALKREGKFEELCRGEWNMDPRVARRYMDTARHVNTHLADKQDVIDRLAPGVLYRMASGHVGEQVVEEVLKHAESGQKVLPADLRAIQKKFDAELEAKDNNLQNALNDLAATRESLEQATHKADQAELSAARLKEHADRLADNVQRYAEEMAQLTIEHGEMQQQIAELNKRLENPPTLEVAVPKIPTGFKTLDEAIKSKEKELRVIEQRIAKAQDQVATSQRQLAAIQGDVATQQANADVLAAFRADIQALCAKYPATLVAVAADEDPRVAVECAAIASHLRALAEQIESTAQVNPTARKRAKPV